MLCVLSGGDMWSSGRCVSLGGDEARHRVLGGIESLVHDGHRACQKVQLKSKQNDITRGKTETDNRAKLTCPIMKSSLALRSWGRGACCGCGGSEVCACCLGSSWLVETALEEEDRRGGDWEGAARVASRGWELLLDGDCRLVANAEGLLSGRKPIFNE